MRPRPEIVERDDGRYALGWHDDAPGPFASRQHAEAVLAKEQPVKPREERRVGTS